MLHLLPPLLNAAMLALLGSSIPLLASFTSTVVVVSADGEIFSSPPVAQLQKAKSIHVMVYSSEGALILVESEGSFDIEILEACLASGRNECLSNQSGDVEMIDNEKVNMSKKFEQSVEARIKKSEQWRNGIKGSGS